jgi:S1-C subfamily serine protease
MSENKKPTDENEVKIKNPPPKEAKIAKQYLAGSFLAVFAIVAGAYFGGGHREPPPPGLQAPATANATAPRLPTAPFGGIGVGLNPTPQGPVVARAYPGTPAEKAGLQQGDVILAIDKVSAAGIDIPTASSRLRGPEGTSVTITYSRNGGPPQDVTITRVTIHPEVFQQNGGK